AGDARDLAVEEAREVDDVGHQVAERTRTGLAGIEPPRVERRVVAPVLEIAAPEMTHLAELSSRDHLARQAHGRDEAVVERAPVLDPGGGDLPPDLVALGGVAAERLLAHDVLARAGGGDRRLGVQRVRSAVVEQSDALVGYEIAPIRGGVVPAVPERRL